MQHGNISNLILKEYVPPLKEPIFRFSYPSYLNLISSTFNNHSIGKSNFNNINDHFDLVKGSHSFKGWSNLLGKPKDKKII